MGSVAFTYVLVNYNFRLDTKEEDAVGIPKERRSGEWENKLLGFESHYAIAGWDSGPFVQFKQRE